MEIAVHTASHGDAVQVVIGNMCSFGMWSADASGPGLASKPTKFMTEAVGIKCCGGHRHIRLMEGRAQKAQAYPRDLCRAACRGMVNQLLPPCA